jgi:Na+/H+ antiporter NhaD/arsenite permease-like protein
VVATALMGVFLFTDWPRDVAALVGAGVLLLSRRLHSSRVMGFVDWAAAAVHGPVRGQPRFDTTGLAGQAVAWLAAQGVHLADPGRCWWWAWLLSNLVSNVPAVMLLLPHLQGPLESARPADAGAGQHLGRQPAAAWWARSPT